jgi:hypothetical protein
MKFQAFVAAIKKEQASAEVFGGFHHKLFMSSLLIIALILSGCDNYRTTESCDDYFSTNPDLSSEYDEAPRGLLTHTPSQTTWVRCPAGMSNGPRGNCRGEPLAMTFADANAYALEVAEKSGTEIRLPTSEEMRRLFVSHCNNPAIDVRAFPDIQVDNHWTSDASRTNSLLACAVYTYQGNVSCRESKDTPYPFLLLMEMD